MNEQDKSTNCVRFCGKLSVRSIEEYKISLLEAIRNHAVVEVDCRDATEVDVLFLQLLVSARLTAQGWGKSLVLASPAEGVLRAALERGGFTAGCEATAAAGAFWNNGSDAQ